MTDVTYEGMDPGMAEWWIAHLDTAPAVVIRCGHRDSTTRDRECRNAIGEAKATGDDRVLAMSKNETPEITTDWTRLGALTAEELAADIAERDAQALRYVGTGPGDGSVVYRRQSYPCQVAPIEYLSYYVCRVHGDVEVDTADLAAFARAAIKDTPGVTRTYRAHRDVD